MFAVGIGSQVVIIKWNGKSTRAKIVRRILSLDQNIPSSRTSIARVGARGRFYGGTFYDQQCKGSPALSFYKYDPILGLKRIFGDLISTSGIAFDDTNAKLYHLDSCQSLITSYDGSQPEGDLCNGQIAFDFKTISQSLQSQYIIGLEADTTGLLYTVSSTGLLYIINPW